MTQGAAIPVTSTRGRHTILGKLHRHSLQQLPKGKLQSAVWELSPFFPEYQKERVPGEVPSKFIVFLNVLRTTIISIKKRKAGDLQE